MDPLFPYERTIGLALWSMPSCPRTTTTNTLTSNTKEREEEFIARNKDHFNHPQKDVSAEVRSNPQAQAKEKLLQ